LHPRRVGQIDLRADFLEQLRLPDYLVDVVTYETWLPLIAGTPLVSVLWSLAAFDCTASSASAIPALASLLISSYALAREES